MASIEVKLEAPSVALMPPVISSESDPLPPSIVSNPPRSAPAIVRLSLPDPASTVSSPVESAKPSSPAPPISVSSPAPSASEKPPSVSAEPSKTRL